MREHSRATPRPAAANGELEQPVHSQPAVLHSQAAAALVLLPHAWKEGLQLRGQTAVLTAPGKMESSIF